MKRTQYYREVKFADREPPMSANNYFYTIYISNGHTYTSSSGYPGHMRATLNEIPGSYCIWLEPEHEYDPDTYYSRISKSQ